MVAFVRLLGTSVVDDDDDDDGGGGVTREGTGCNHELEIYRREMQDASGYMHLLCIRMCAVRVIKGEYIVRRVSRCFLVPFETNDFSPFH